MLVNNTVYKLQVYNFIIPLLYMHVFSKYIISTENLSLLEMG